MDTEKEGLVAGEHSSRRVFFIRSATTAALTSGIVLASNALSVAGGHLNPKVHQKKSGSKHKQAGGASNGTATNRGTGTSTGTSAGNGASATRVADASSSNSLEAERVKRNRLGRPLPDLYAGLNSRSFKEIQGDENAHVTFLINALTKAGAPVRQRPSFQNLEQPTYQAFGMVSKALENTGTGAYLGALPYISNPDYVAAAGSIAQIEARHSGWLNTLLNNPITQNAFGAEEEFERALTQQEVLSLAGPFIANVPDMNTLRLGFDLTKSAMNDVLILNFALTLEYLEQDFYNINVPKFYH